ncbi:Rlf2p PWA37_000350 [Arxiozyma heterogenica]|uniref:Rlf2p n=1 Tax=Arxiozyma heterogenica TaxID=278026 RepID=UPI002F234814
MTGVNQRGILSFFQNVSSQKTKFKENTASDANKHCKDEKTDYRKKELENKDNGDVILIMDEQVESEDNHLINADLNPQNHESNQNKNIKDSEEKSKVALGTTVENIDSRQGETALNSSTKISFEPSFSENQIDENLDEKGNEKEKDTSKSSEIMSKNLIKKEQLIKDKELKKLEREQEQLMKRKKKEEERRKREEEKQRREQLKEEERRKREEEKQRRERIKEEERRRREEAKRAKEAEKRKREEERLKKENEKRAKQEAKERAQLRIGNFFKKSLNETIKPVVTKSDYERVFRPFYTRDNIIISNISALSQNKLETNKQYIDNQLLHKSDNSESIFDWVKSKRVERGYKIKLKAVALLQQMTTKEKTDEELQHMLSMIPQKYIKFYENVRPPFIGTYSKDFRLPVSRPFCTDVADYNYDYDSDLEWVNGEDEEGDGAGVDNLESGDDEDDDDDEDDGSEGEFDGFLDTDDPNNTNQSKKKIIGPLIPVVFLRHQLDELEADDKDYFKNTSVQPLIENLPLPIDPSKAITVPKLADQLNNVSSKKQSFSCEKRTISEVGITGNDGSPGAKKPKLLITDSTDLLRLFNEIHGSTFSLGTVTEIAQKGLPQYNKLTIKNTVREYATRVSSKGDSSRKWEINDMEFWEKLKTEAV